jgi:ribosomal protein S24E
MDTTKNIRNDLFKRKEISFIIESGKNPNFDEMRKKIAEDFKKGEEAVDVYGVKGSFGSNKFKIEAYVYDSQEDLEKARQLTQKQRKEIKKAAEDAKKAADEAKKAEEDAKAAAEKPAEEVKDKEEA